MQEAHVTLPDFYKQWLMALSEVRKLSNNQFAASLHESLTKRLTNLRNSQAFKMALYLDPRFNFCGSKLFTAGEKAEIQVFSNEKLCITNDHQYTLTFYRNTLLACTKEFVGFVHQHLRITLLHSTFLRHLNQHLIHMVALMML